MADPALKPEDAPDASAPIGQYREGEPSLSMAKKKTVAEPISVGRPEVQGPPAADRSAALEEAKRRGIITPDQYRLYNEALSRGLIPTSTNIREFAKTPVPGSPEIDTNLLKEAVRDPGGMATKIVEGAKKTAAARRERALKAIRMLRGMDQDVDYQDGLDWAAKFAITDADNPAEAERGLMRIYPQAKVGQDKGGRWWVDQAGRKVAVFPDSIGGELSETVAGFFTATPETAGAVGGGTIGAGAGPVGAMAGAGVGGALGKGLSEVRKGITGVFHKRPDEELRTLLSTGLVNLGGEAVARGLAGGARGSMGKLRSGFFEVTPESRAMTENLLSEGARPPMVTVAPGAKSFQYDQMLRNMVKGDPQQERNLQFAMDRLHKMLKLSGIPDRDIAQVFDSIVNPRTAVSVRQEAETIAAGAYAAKTGLEMEADASLATARSIADEQGKALEQLGEGVAPEAAHGAFVAAAQKSRREFGAAMSRVYDDIDAMVGGQAIIPTAMAKKAAAEIVELMPASNSPSIFHEIKGLPPMVTLKQAQRFRTRLSAESDSGNLTPGTVEHDYGEVSSAFDGSMQPEMVAEGVPREAVSALKAADATYRDGIAKYRDAKLNQMIRDFRNQKHLDAEKFAASLFDTQSTFRVNSYRQIVGPEVWRTVQAADLKNVLKSASRLASDAGSTRRIDGVALSTILHTRGPMLDAIYGKDVADQWQQYASRLAALDGKIDAANLKPDNFTAALGHANTVRQQLEEFSSLDPIRALSKGGPEQVDAAVTAMTRAGQEAQLDHVIRFFGEDSAVVHAIRSAAIKRALSEAVTRDVTGLGARVAGEKIDAFLSRYSRAEQDMLFPNGMAGDLRMLADEMKALFPPGYQDMGASLAAAGIKGKVPFSVGADLKWLHVAFKGWLADRPTVIRTIAGIPGSTSEAKAIRRAALKVIWRQFLNEEAQQVRSTAQQPRRAVP